MKGIYWTSTGLVALMLVLSAASYLFHRGTIEGVRALGFPDYFRIQLAVMKLLAAVVLLLPQMPPNLKEWAYAGVGLFLITAIVAHAAHRDPLLLNAINFAFLGLLAVSYVFLKRMSF